MRLTAHCCRMVFSVRISSLLREQIENDIGLDFWNMNESPILMNEFYAMFENDDSDNRLFDTKCPLHYAGAFTLCY